MKRRQMYEAKKAARSAVRLPLPNEANTIAQTPSVDTRRLEERAYRRGLIDALSVIIRELN